MNYPGREGLRGLPGGHLEPDELPDEALVREINEELGVTIDNFTRMDFFMRGGRGSSVILAYTGSAPAGIVLNPPHPEHEFGMWVTKSELEMTEDISSEYKRFTLHHWPIN